MGRGHQSKEERSRSAPFAPWDMCGSAGIPGCWEGAPEDTNQEHEADLGEMLEGPAQSRTLTRQVRLGGCESPPEDPQPGATLAAQAFGDLHSVPAQWQLLSPSGGGLLSLSKVTPVWRPDRSPTALQAT